MGFSAGEVQSPDSVKELKRINLSDYDNLHVDNGTVSADAAVSVKIDTPAKVNLCRLFSRSFSTTGVNEIELNHLNHASGSPALLWARAVLPVELKQKPLALCIEIKGSKYEVDTVHFIPIQVKKESTLKESLSPKTRLLPSSKTLNPQPI